MNEAMLTTLILGAEIGGLVLLFFLVITFFVLRRRRSNKKHVAEFIASYKKDLPARIDAFKNRLENDHYIIGEDADKVLGKISDTETRLHKHILNLYLGNNKECLSDISNDVSSLNEKWLAIMGDSITNAADVLGKTEVISEMQHNYEELKDENTSLRKELTEAMKSMEEMLKEYSLLYADQGEKNETMERLSGEYDELKAKTKVHIKDR